MSGINVSAEAQARICRFSNLTHQATVLKDKKAYLLKKIQSLDDAEDELALSMQSDDVWVKCGESLSSSGPRVKSPPRKRAIISVKQRVALSCPLHVFLASVGECYVQRPLEAAEEVAAASKKEASAELQKTDEKLQEIERETVDLKAKLYAELGNTVNLDK